jgi:hypothetical protein
MGYHGVRVWGPYPGRGPWSHLPPWERPGWWYGRGRCWYWLAPYWRGPIPYPPISKEDEIRYLEELKRYITDVVLKDIDKRLEELRGK